MIRAAVGSFCAQRITFVQFQIGESDQIGESGYYGRVGLKFGTLLYPDYHSLKLTIFDIQQNFKFVMSDYPLINFELGMK